ncbi:MAG TPA: hypothetical protein VFA21_00480 [Pyrinomonadaceae bacterium]|nr:hypothetical protein [Pyrinomonadaceae bacterium]
MKKRTVITTEKREVWVIRRAEDGQPATQDAPRGDAPQSDADAAALGGISESESQEGSDEEGSGEEK